MRTSWSRPKWYGFIALLLLSGCALGQTSPSQPATQGWDLVWSDEFDGANGSGVDSKKWVTEVGGNGWGNDELEYYTASTKNAFLQDGNLVIKAYAEKHTGSDGVSRNYTSARLKTEGKFSQTYG